MKLQRAFFVVIALMFVVSLGSLLTGGNDQKAQVIGTPSLPVSNAAGTLSLSAPTVNTTLYPGQTTNMTCAVTTVTENVAVRRLVWSWFQNNGAQGGEFHVYQYGSGDNSDYLYAGNHTRPVTMPNITPGSNFKLQCQVFFRDLATGTNYSSISQSVPMNFTTGTPPPSPVFGCTDPSATNYNPNATQNDGSCTYQTSDTSAPTNPTNLAVSGATSYTLNLSWTASTDNIGVTQYKIYRNNGGSTSVNTTTPYATVNAPATTYTDIGLLSSKNYKYRIVAVDASGNVSAWGTVTNSTTNTTASGTTLAVVRPTNLTTLNPTQSTITLSWTTPASGEIYDYEIYASNTTNVGTVPKVIIPASGANNTTLTYVFESNANITLQPNTTYYFKVKARDPAANKSNFATKVGSSSTTIVSGKTLAVTTPAPNAPTNLNVTATGSTTATATWTDNSTNETGFTLQRATNSGFTSGLTTISSTISANTQSFNVTGLSSGATYYFRVRADASTSSGWNTFGPLVMPTADTSAPTATIDVPNDGQVFSAGTQSTQFLVTTNENATCKWSTSDMAYSSMPNTFTPTGTTTHTTTINLADGASYTRYVRCQDTIGNVMTTSENVAFSVASPVDTTAPAIPTLSVGAVTSTTVALSWNAVTDPSSPVTYKIYRNGTYIGSPISGTSVTDGTTTPLVAGTTYTYTISACDNAPTQNCSAQSSGVTATTTAIPTIVSSLEVVQTNGTSISTLASGQQLNIGSQANATYTPLSGSFSIKANPGTPAPTSIKFDLTGPTGFTAYTQCESSAPYALYGDVSGVFNSWPTSTQVLGAYTLTVTPYSLATCAGSAGTPFVRQFILANFDDSTPPTNPSGAASTYRSAGEIRLSWTASTDTGGISHYSVTRVPGTTTNVGNQTTFIDTNVTSNGTYSYTITAVDNVGNTSGVSNAVSAPTLSTSFANGNQVETNTTTGIKVTPDATGNIGNQAAGIVGVITNSSAGPVNPVWVSGGANYWYVDFATGTDGWVNENNIDSYIPPPADTTPPTADITAPTNGQVLTSGTTTVTMYVTTNENATCKWATTDIAYASMTNTFTGSGTTAHNYPLLGLTDGTSYTRYVRCQDTIGNQMTTSASVTFSVATGTPSGNAPVVSTPQRSFTPNQIAVVCNSQWTQSCAVADYYIQQRGIPPQNKVTLNFAVSPQFNSGSMMTKSMFETGFGGTNMRAYVLNQITSAYSSAGLGTPDIQGAMLLWRYPYGVKNNTDSTCYASSQDCLALTTAFAKGQYLSADANNSSSAMPTNAYFESSANFLTPRQSSNLIPTFLLPFEYGNYNEGKQFVDNGIVADNTYPTGKVYTRTTFDLRSNTRHSNHITMSGLFNQNNLSTEHVNSVLNPNGTNESYNRAYCSDILPILNGQVPAISPTDPGNWLINQQNVLGYHTGIACPPYLSALNFLPGALADHVTSVSGALTQSGTSGGSEDAQMNIQKWLNYGVVASAGTIKEPWESNQAYRSKFAKTTQLWTEYYTGASALQSYWSAIEKNGHTNIVGEPLANPWKDPQITFANNILTINITHIKPGETWKLQSSTNGTSWTDVSGQTSITAPNGKLGLRTVTVTNATAPYYKLVNTNNSSLPQIVRPVNGSDGGGVLLGDFDNPTWSGGNSNLVVGSPTTTSLSSTWNTATDATQPVTYKLQRRVSGGTFAEVYSGTSTTFANTGLLAGTTYEFQVRACDGVGIPNCTSWSSTASGTTSPVLDTTAPTTPGTPTVSSTTSSSIGLSWTASTDNVGVTGYKVFRSTTSGGTYTEVGTSTSNSYIDGGLPASSTYFYKISAYDAAGNNSAQSGASSGIATQAVQSGGQTVSGINGPVGPNLLTNTTSCTNPSGGTIYYIDAVAGNDSNNGTSTATAWKTIDKINSSMSSINAGKMICFKRGQVHRGRLNLATSGSSSSPITIDAYGTGSAPVISGNVLVTNWTQHSGNIWKATVSAPATTPKGLFVGGNYQTNARQPNAGWYFTNARTVSSISDTNNSWLSSQTANSLTNGEVVMRGSPWSYSIVKISGNSGSTISGSSYDNPGASISYGNWNADLEWGYFLRNKLSFLDTAGEWYFDASTNTVYLWAPGSANPNSLTVELSSFSEGIYIGNNRTDFVVRNLVFEGQTAYGINIRSGSKRITMENLELRNADAGIYQYGNSSEPASDRNVYRNNYLHDLTTSGIYVAGGADHLIEGNVVERIGVVENRFYTSKMSYIGIIPASTGSGINTKTVKRNIVRDTGYAGIAAAGGGLITENLIERSMVTLTDGSAITWDGTDGMTISKNIVKDVGVGSSQAFTNSPNMASQPLLWIGYTPRDKGLYFGDSSAGPIRNTFVDDNVVINTTTGIFLDHNNTFYGNKVRNNIVFDFNNAGLGFGDWSNYRSFPNGCSPDDNSPCFVGQYDDVVTGNKIYGRASYQNLVYMLHSYSNGTGVVADFGTIDNNYYSNPYRTIKIKQDRNFNSNHQEWTLAQWQANSNEDDNSSAPAYTPTAQPQIFYNATLSTTQQNVGNACRVNGQPTGGTQTFSIPPFSAIVAEYGNC